MDIILFHKYLDNHSIYLKSHNIYCSIKFVDIFLAVSVISFRKSLHKVQRLTIESMMQQKTLVVKLIENVVSFHLKEKKDLFGFCAGRSCALTCHGFAASVGVCLSSKDQAVLVHRTVTVVNVDVPALDAVRLLPAHHAAVVPEFPVVAAEHPAAA